MSRRRRAPRTVAPGIRFTVECDGSETHPVRRIAKVRAVPWPDAPGGHAIRVEYVLADQDPEDNDYMMPVRSMHMTRRFVCRTCGRDRPMTDENLAKLAEMLDTLGRSRVRLREIPAIVSRE